MRHRTESSYRSSHLARTKVKKAGFFALFSKLFMEPPMGGGLVEDRANSTTIIRIIVGLLLVHLIIIGGIILHGKIENAPATTTATIEAPPTEAPPIVLTEPEPVPGPTANPTTITQPAAPATQPAVPCDVEVVSVPTTVSPAPVVTEPVVTKPKDVAHKLVQITSGDTLRKIAERNNVTVQAILDINPEITNANMLQAGHKIRIPLAADSQEAKDLAQVREAERVEKEGLDYVISPGDTLSKLQRKFGTTVTAIQKINNMGSSTNLRSGQKIKIPATDKAKKLLQK